MKALCIVSVLACVLPFADFQSVVEIDPYEYDPTWESLDARPLPSWYDNGKIGIFIHWGVFSVPSFSSEWFWTSWVQENGNGSISDFMRQNYPPNFTYQDFARDFTAEFYNPSQWADIFAASGAKYVVLTSKHHEGYTLWPSIYSFSWNAQDVGPNRDLLGELAQAIRNRTDLRFGVYHSLYEWYNPLYLADKANQYSTTDFVDSKTLPELYELVQRYQPEVIWSDGDWETNENYWKSKMFLAWLYNESPVRDTVVTNDRWGSGTGCTHGGFFNCADRYSPGVLQQHKWENALTIDRDSWGFRRNAPLDSYLKIEELLGEIVKTVSCGGNVLVNVGPTKDGIITPIFEERLRQMGAWLSVNGEAIYESQPWTFQNDTVTPDVWYTRKGSTVYASVINWPTDNQLVLTAPKTSSTTVITLLADSASYLPFTVQGSTVQIQLPPKSGLSVDWVYVLKMTNIVN